MTPIPAFIPKSGRNEGNFETKHRDCFFQSSVRLKLHVGAGEEVGTFLLFNPIPFILGS